MNRDTIGVLLVNVGTPDAPDAGAVRKYLREFLGDPRVLDINPVGRWLLLNLIILPRRPAQSAEAYRKVWTDEGSPLLLHSEALAAALQKALGETYRVKVGMRYGNPSLAHAMDTFRNEGLERFVVFPLYPQYAASSTGTSVSEIYRLVGQRWNVPAVSVVAPFYDDAGMIACFASIGREVIDEVDADHVLFSFHGLPERHIRKSDETGEHCLRMDECCAAMGHANRYCYRAQCYETARRLARELGLPPGEDGWSVTFQSRLGRTPWIRPYTDEVIVELARQGTRRLAVFCPAFVADCLETLEEIGLRAEADFKAAGGESLTLVPSLNAHPRWVEAAARLVREAAPRLG